jgi:hypothetical protein
MAESPGQPVTVAKAVVPIEADLSAFERQLDEIDQRTEDLGAKLGKLFDPMLSKLAEVEERLEGFAGGSTGALDPIGEPQPGRNGGSVQALGPESVASSLERLTISVEENTEQLRALTDVIRAWIASQQ